MTKQASPSMGSFIAIRYWPSWLGLSILWLIAYLPFYCRLKIGSALGHTLYFVAKSRRHITQTNFDLCFPELSIQERKALTRRCFRENGIGLIESSTGWLRSPENFSDMLSIIGRKHLDLALAKGKGVLILGAHYTTLDFSANLLSLHYPFAVTYRAHKNPLFDAFIRRGRLKNCNGVFDRNDIRGAFRHLRKGLILWYAPDQNYNSKQTVFAPFFGVPASTITVASRFARFNDSPTLLVRHHRRGDSKRYEIEFIPFPENFPSNDTEDACLINKMLEEAICVCPEQYLWMHRRFKTQAGGELANPYKKSS